MEKVKLTNDAKRFNMVVYLYENAKDDHSALLMADRLCQSWFDCDCATLINSGLSEIYSLVAHLPCTVRLIPKEILQSEDLCSRSNENHPVQPLSLSLPVAPVACHGRRCSAL